MRTMVITWLRKPLPPTNSRPDSTTAKHVGLHRLIKSSILVMLLRNLNLDAGLANCTFRYSARHFCSRWEVDWARKKHYRMTSTKFIRVWRSSFWIRFQNTSSTVRSRHCFRYTQNSRATLICRPEFNHPGLCTWSTLRRDIKNSKCYLAWVSFTYLKRCHRQIMEPLKTDFGWRFKSRTVCNIYKVIFKPTFQYQYNHSLGKKKHGLVIVVQNDRSDWDLLNHDNKPR